MHTKLYILEYIYIYIYIYMVNYSLSTYKCNWSYGPPIEMGIVSQVGSCPQLGLSTIS